MVNEDRVKQLYKIAIYEQNEEKEHREAGLYYRSDYIAKEVVKSIFVGTLAYLIMTTLWVISNWSLVMYQINTLEIVDTVVIMLVIYLIFLVIYTVATGIVYYHRYKVSEKKLKEYIDNLDIAYKMFEREEKLKN